MKGILPRQTIRELRRNRYQSTFREEAVLKSDVYIVKHKNSNDRWIKTNKKRKEKTVIFSQFNIWLCSPLAFSTCASFPIS